MKSKYVQSVNLKLETGHDGLYIGNAPWSIDPIGMDKRVDVFINQLLPDMLAQARTVEGINFALNTLGKHLRRFIPRVVSRGNPKQVLMVLIAATEATTLLFKKELEFVEKELEMVLDE